jgi:hypothetical protein
MKHFFLISSAFLLIPLFSGCKASTVHIPVDPYANVTIEYVTNNCTPTENYQFPVFGVYAMPSRTKNCAGVEDLWLVRWPGENTEIEQTTAKLLTLLYVKSVNENQDPDVTSTFIKNDTIVSRVEGQPTFHAAFYELKEVPGSTPKETIEDTSL